MKRRLRHRRRRQQPEASHAQVNIAESDSQYSPDKHPILRLQQIIGNAALLRQLKRVPEAHPVANGISPLLRAMVQRDPEDEVSQPLSDHATENLDPQWLDSLSLDDLSDLKKVVEADVLISQKDEAVDAASFETSKDNLKVIHQTLAAKLNDKFDKLPTNIGIPTSAEDRIEFLDVMSAYLGSHEKVLTHYADIQPANTPGKPMLHKNARAQLEAVATELGGKVPSTTVGAHTRGRYHANNLQPMGHVLGFAIDFRAVDNPRIGDQDTLVLVRMDTGGKANFDLGMSRKQRRKFIGEMQAGSADKKQMEQFFEKFDKEYERVSKASQQFGDILGADAKTDMQTLRTRYFKNLTDKLPIQKRLKEIGKALLSRKNRDPDKQSALNDEQTKLTEDLEKIDEDQGLVLDEAQVILQPWQEEITKRKEAVETANPDVFDGSPVDEKKLSKAERKRRKYAKGEWDVYDSLEKRLNTDLAFLFGKLERGKPKLTVASQPSVTQLLERGFFNPDPEPTGKFAAHKHGFNQAFMKAMAAHGFDQGVCWEGASQDSMHFEYVPDYDTVIGQKDTKSKIDRLKQVYYGQKKKPKRKKKRK